MTFVLPPLPYSLDALAPHLSAETLDFHYNKHHASYVAKLNSIAAANPAVAAQTLDAIVKGGPSPALPAGTYNSAAQTWNHTFYWHSLAPNPSGEARKPSEKLEALIAKSFGSYDAFKQKFSDAAAGHFGSGWAWLVQDKASGLLKIVDTHDAVSAASDATITPHAYYIDFRNARPKYIETWWKLVNWQFAESNVKF
ncbi:destroys the superoxide radical which is normally produced within the cells and which are toxic to b [Zopfochytrium polystomum]|nr:destroys the superoxide radical which is normally produced within the cells and which are toxic to b [Zopfochytrium polystomum]